MNPLIQLQRAIPLFLVALTCLALSPSSRAVSPPPDGGYPNGNTAEGDDALFSLTTGIRDTAVVARALFSDTTGRDNTACGHRALEANQTGNENTAIASAALAFNVTGNFNTATGISALSRNTTGNENTANGDFALANSTGSENIGLGNGAGSRLLTGDANIYIGSFGEEDESNTIRIGRPRHNSTFIQGIFGVAISGSVVVVNADGKLGVVTSSVRFKDNIMPMDKSSEALLELKPVTFRYKKQIDPTGTPQFGLVAEEVEKVNADLVVRDKEGKPFSVRYEAVNAMLLNEFLKEHRKIEQQQATISQLQSTVAKQEANAARQQKQIEALTAGLHKVSAQIELGKRAPQTVLNNH
jgi:uncharacterized coiled-coil protein SlyX